MSTFNNKMTAVAAEVRTIDGVNDTLSLDEMAAKLAAANQEIENQAAQIESIMTALEGKAASGGSVNVETATVNIEASAGVIRYAWATIYKDGVFDGDGSDFGVGATDTTFAIGNVLLGSVINIGFTSSAVMADYEVDGGELVASTQSNCIVKVTDNTCTIIQYDTD